MKKIKTFKLDKRYVGHEYFQYSENFTRREKDDFIQRRNWCWQTWGPSCEIEFLSDTETPWCWLTNDFNLRIYLKNEKHLQWYILKWTS